MHNPQRVLSWALGYAAALALQKEGNAVATVSLRDLAGPEREQDKKSETRECV